MRSSSDDDSGSSPSFRDRVPSLLRHVATLTALLIAGCGGSSVTDDAGSFDGGLLEDGGTGILEERIADRAVVGWLRADPSDPWWLEERIAPWPKTAGDHDLGPRAIVRGMPRTVVWAPAEDERITDACMHPSGAWSAIGFDAEQRLFLARGDARGLTARVALDDPELAVDPRAWIEAPPDGLRVGALTESSPTIEADGEDVVVALTSSTFAVLLYRWRHEDGAFVRGPRTLASPARAVSPYLPIGASYDDFDAVVAPYLVHLAVDPAGRAHLAIFSDRGRLARHNAVMGTSLGLLRRDAFEHPSDVLAIGIDPDGSVAYTSVIGTVDRDDEAYGIAASAERVAIVGRTRREPGRDNTELHAFVGELTRDGAVLDARTWDGDASAIAQAAAYAPDGGLWVGGTHAWAQNPSGISLFDDGEPFLFEGSSRRDELVPRTTGHAELRVIAFGGGRVWVAGLENGPLTHTGDRDPTRIRSDAFFRAGPH